MGGAWEYRHQCRYCSRCVYTLQGTWWCDRRDMEPQNPKRPNACPDFAFVEIPADNAERVYKPHRKREGNGRQMLLFGNGDAGGWNG